MSDHTCQGKNIAIKYKILVNETYSHLQKQRCLPDKEYISGHRSEGANPIPVMWFPNRNEIFLEIIKFWISRNTNSSHIGIPEILNIWISQIPDFWNYCFLEFLKIQNLDQMYMSFKVSVISHAISLPAFLVGTW